MFPRAWRVGEYLERYVEKFLGPKGVGIRTGCEVVRATREVDGKWTVLVGEVGGSKSETLEFDYLIVATGFFGKPKVPGALSSMRGSGPRIIHSSKFRNVKDLVGGRKPGKIVVVGGQMSGVEVAASVASQLSSEMWSPGPRTVLEAERFEIHHVISRPLWIMPLYLPMKPTLEVSGEGSSAPVCRSSSSFHNITRIFHV